MSSLLKKICNFIRCRERAAVLVAVLFMVGIVLTSHVVTISAFTGYDLRYPSGPEDVVDLSLHYVRFSSSYSNLFIESTGDPITYSETSGGRSAYVYPTSLYTYFSDGQPHVAIRADAATPKLTSRSTYSVTIPGNTINNSGDYWEGFSDWQIKVPDPFGDAAYEPAQAVTVSPVSLISEGVRAYYPNALPGSLNTDGGYPPSIEMRSCTNSAHTADLSSYYSLEYDTLAPVVQHVTFEQTLLEEFIETVYGSATDGVLAQCVSIDFEEGALVHADTIGSYLNGPTYYLNLLKYQNLVGAGEVINISNNVHTFEFDFNQQISVDGMQGVGKFARLYNSSNELVSQIEILNSGGMVEIRPSTASGGNEGNDALFVTFNYAFSPGQTYYITLDQQAVNVLDSWDYVRADMDSDDYRFTVANDNDAPIAGATNPTFGATNVATSTQDITVSFDEVITLGNQPTTYNISNGVATTSLTASSVGQYDSVSGSQLTIDIAGVINQAYSTTTGLAAGTTYTIEIPETIVDDDQGNNIPSPVFFVFTTVSNPTYDNNRPIVVTKNPAFGATNVATSTQDISLTFDEPVYASTSVQTFRISNGVATSTVVANSVGQYDSVSGSTLTIEIDELVNQAYSTTTGLAAQTTYTVEIPQYIVRDDVGDYMSGPAYFVFTTVDNYDEPIPDPEPEPEPEPEEEDSGRPPSSRRRSNVGGGAGSGVGGSTPGFGNNVATHEDIGPISTFRDLFFGATGSDVLELQRALNRIGFTVSETGAGSLGQETEYFGTSTQSAVTRFQLNFGIAPSFGYFGPITRALLGFILGR